MVTFYSLGDYLSWTVVNKNVNFPLINVYYKVSRGWMISALRAKFAISKIQKTGNIMELSLVWPVELSSVEPKTVKGGKSANSPMLAQLFTIMENIVQSAGIQSVSGKCYILCEQACY